MSRQNLIRAWFQVACHCPSCACVGALRALYNCPAQSLVSQYQNTSCFMCSLSRVLLLKIKMHGLFSEHHLRAFDLDVNLGTRAIFANWWWCIVERTWLLDHDENGCDLGNYKSDSTWLQGTHWIINLFENDQWPNDQFLVAKIISPQSEEPILVCLKILPYFAKQWVWSHLNVFVFGPLKGCQTPIATDPFDIKLDFWQPTHHSPFECSHVCGRILIEKSHIWPRRYFLGIQQTTKFLFF